MRPRLQRMKSATLAAAFLLVAPAAAVEEANPACELLTETEATAALGAEATERIMNPEMTGASDCSWVAANEHAIALSRTRGLAFQGSATAADSYRNWRETFEAKGKVETLTGLGEQAFLFVEGTVEGRAIIGILRQGNVLLIGTSGVARGALMTIANLAAGRV